MGPLSVTAKKRLAFIPAVIAGVYIGRSAAKLYNLQIEQHAMEAREAIKRFAQEIQNWEMESKIFFCIKYETCQIWRLHSGFSHCYGIAYALSEHSQITIVFSTPLFLSSINVDVFSIFAELVIADTLILHDVGYLFQPSFHK
ncbi:hypothetical protein ACSBR2_013571 [Camellia fascicularis]